MTAKVQAIIPGTAIGPAIVLDEPVSLWGGVDAETGCIIDRQHPQLGVCLTGAIVFMRSGRGSSSASSVLAEAIRLGTAPAAFVIEEPDEILVLGSLVGEELYGIATPVVIADPEATRTIETGDTVTVDRETLAVADQAHDGVARS